MILAGDIGGTNTRLALFGDDLRPAREQSFRNADHGGLADVLRAFDADGRLKDLTAACFGVAGPVEARAVRLTNLAWTIEADALAGALGLPPRRVTLVNDMVAHAASTAGLGDAEIEAIQPGRADPLAARAILMPGTGLGVGGMTFDAAAGHVRPFPSEGGHVDFAPGDADEERLARSMRRLHGDDPDRGVSWEDVLSGPGLRRVYACLADPDRPDVDAAPPSKWITDAAADGSDRLAAATVDRFVRLLGSAAGNLALGMLATGGVYLGGTIVTALAGRLRGGALLDSFGRVGPPAMRGVLARVPVLRIDARETGLRGAAQLARWARDEG